MKKMFWIMIIVSVLSGCGSRNLQQAVTTEAVRNDQRVMSEYNTLAEQHSELASEYKDILRDNDALRERLVQAERVAPLLEAAAQNSSRDNVTLNALVRWDAFGADVRMVVVFVGLLVVLSLGANVALVVVLMRKTGASKNAPRQWIDTTTFEWDENDANQEPVVIGAD